MKTLGDIAIKREEAGYWNAINYYMDLNKSLAAWLKPFNAEFDRFGARIDLHGHVIPVAGTEAIP